MKYKNLLYMMMLIVSTLITLSSDNWMGMWMGLEMNLMSFIPLISKKKNTKSSQAMMIYFLTQSIGSIVLLFSILMNNQFMTGYWTMQYINKMMLILSITLKMGAAPFHMWFVEVMSKMNWKECYLLMTWQKIAPMTIMSTINLNNNLMYMLIIASTIAGAIGGLNQTSMRKMMAYSSINHMGWMLAMLMMSNMWYKYLIMYSLLLYMIIMYMNENNIFFMNQMINNNSSLMEKYYIIIMMMSLGGMPPFLGFMPKWMTLQMLMNLKMYLLTVMMVMFSLITLFYYLRMMSKIMMSLALMPKWMTTKPKPKYYLYTSIMINMSLPMIIMMNFF